MSATAMKISVVIPTYNRPEQLAEAIASVAVQDLSLIDEVIIGDNSSDEMRAANADVIAASPIASLIRHQLNNPPTDNFGNQYALARSARCDHMLILHDDDHLIPGGLRHLADACVGESDPLVKVWFGRNYTMSANGHIDLKRTVADTRMYGKDGPAAVRPLWQWCVTESLPPNSALMDRQAYLAHMEGPRDGNVGDWGLWVRMANSGLRGHFIPDFVWSYRVQEASQTSSGRGMDTHRYYELALQLEVGPEAQARMNQRISEMAPVATLRYLRDGERARAFRCLVSGHWHWRQRFSPRGLITAAMLLMPGSMITWALHQLCAQRKRQHDQAIRARFQEAPTIDNITSW